MLLKTPYGQPKGMSYASPARYEDLEDKELNNCKMIGFTNVDKNTTLATGDPPLIQKVITYGVLDLLSEVGGLIKIWALTIGSLSSFLLHRILKKELQKEKIKETVTFNNIKRVSDDVDDLKADSAPKNNKIKQLVNQNIDLENQIQETRDSQ